MYGGMMFLLLLCFLATCFASVSLPFSLVVQPSQRTLELDSEHIQISNNNFEPGETAIALVWNGPTVRFVATRTRLLLSNDSRSLDFNKASVVVGLIRQLDALVLTDQLPLASCVDVAPLQRHVDLFGFVFNQTSQLQLELRCETTAGGNNDCWSPECRWPALAVHSTCVECAPAATFPLAATVVVLLGLLLFCVVLVVLLVFLRRSFHHASGATPLPLATTLPTAHLSPVAETTLRECWDATNDQVAASPRVLKFVPDGSTAPIGAPQNEEFRITNRTAKKLFFQFHLPIADSELFSLEVQPNAGSIDGRQTIECVATFTPSSTVRVDRLLSLAFARDQRQLDNQPQQLPLQIVVNGAISTHLDPDEIVLIGQPLGQGSFGAVFAGEYRHQLVAVKVLPNQSDLRSDQLADFEREIDLLQRLRHNTIVQFIGASYVRGRLAICTELFDKGSLGRALICTQLPHELKVRILCNIASAVSFLHANGCLYRDLKPDNVLLASTSFSAKVNAKLADFGTSKTVRTIEELHHHTANVGTPMYMAPELLDAQASNDKADIYSFGMMMYEVYFQEVPWQRVRLWDLAPRVVRGDRPDVSLLHDQLYRRLVEACWHGDQAMRPAANALHERLDTIRAKAHSMRQKALQHAELVDDPQLRLHLLGADDFKMALKKPQSVGVAAQTASGVGPFKLVETGSDVQATTTDLQRTLASLTPADMLWSERKVAAEADDDDPDNVYSSTDDATMNSAVTTS